MAPAERIIDPEWAEMLVSLRMSVPNCWWLGHKRQSTITGSDSHIC